VTQVNGVPHLGKINGADNASGANRSNGSTAGAPIDYDECLACQ
jgi:hypothetical protein